MPLSTEDRLALHELLARYTHSLDYQQLEGMRDLWTEDCQFTADDPPVNVSGIDPLLQFFSDTIAAVPDVRHVVSNIITEGEGDRATLQAYVRIIDFHDKQLVAAGRYQDELIRRDDGWRIHRRQFTAG